MRRIYKYTMLVGDGELTINLPKSYRVLKAGTQDGHNLVMWALVDPDEETMVFTYRIVGTGHDYDLGDEFLYFDTVQMPTGLVWHIFGKSRKA